MTKASTTDDWCGPTSELDGTELRELLRRARAGEDADPRGLASGSRRDLATADAASLPSEIHDQVTAAVVVDTEALARDEIITEPVRPVRPRRLVTRTERVRARIRALTPPALPVHRGRRPIIARVVIAVCVASAAAAGVAALAS